MTPYTHKNFCRTVLASAFACLLAFVVICPAQAQTEPPEPKLALNAESSNAPASAAVPQTSQEQPDWLLETTGGFTHVTNNYGNWYGGSMRLTYRGNSVFAPTLSMATQTRPEGNQQTYGLESYIHFSKSAYAHAGVSTAPNHGAVIFPSFRYDVMGYVKPPKLTGLITNFGYSYYRMGGNISKSISVGGIYYYKKVVFDGGIAFNRSDPGNLPSKSGYFSFMTGTQGRYWFGGGAHGGDLNYRLLGLVPYDAHFNGYGFSAYFQKWIGKHWGLTERYYFTNLIDAYKSNAILVTFFVEF